MYFYKSSRSSQNLENYTFASQFEADDFIQKVISLIKKPEPTKINRIPAPWREKFRCFSLADNDFLYIDEKLVIPKTLRPIILRSPHYGHPPRQYARNSSQCVVAEASSRSPGNRANMPTMQICR